MARQKSSTAKSSASLGSRISQIFESGGLVLLLIVLILIFWLNPTSGSTFVSGPNINNLLANQSVTAIIALAMVIPLAAGYFDLSVAAVAGLTNVTVAGFVATFGVPIWVALIAGMIVAVVCGLVNAYLVAGLKLNGFVVTLGTYTLIGGIVQFITNGRAIYSGMPIEFGKWGMDKFLWIPNPLWLLIIVVLLTWYVLMQTPFGRRLESIGVNEKAARLVGVRVDKTIAISFILSSLLAGVAGILLTSRTGGADPNAATAFLFPALTAVFLGATAIRPGKYNVWGTIIGVFLVAVAINGLILSGGDAWVTPTFNGLALVAAVAVSTLVGRRRRNQAVKEKREKPEEAVSHE